MSTAGWTISTAVVAASCVVGWGTNYPRSSLFGPVRWRGNPNDDRVALTFDDGPTPGATEPVLDALAALNVRASFFVIGKNVVRHPELLRRVFDAGHLIGNHSFDHSHTGFLGGRSYWNRQIESTDTAVAAVIGVRPSMFRPPMGVRTWHTTAAVRRADQISVTWSRRGFDGIPTTADRICRRVVPSLTGGDIVLLHDGIEPGGTRNPLSTAEALPDIVEAIRRAGFKPVRLDELLHVPGAFKAVQPGPD